MKRSIISAALLAAALCTAQDIVKNGKFDAPADYGVIPPQWTSETPSAWAFLNDDGIADAKTLPNCIRFTSNGSENVIASQKLTLKANSTYLLSASIKQNGTLPTVMIVDSKGNSRAKLSVDRDINNIWQDYFCEFNTRDCSDFTLQLVGSITGANGTSFFDNVNLIEGSRSAIVSKSSAENAFKPAGPNIAKGKKYTFSKDPNYGLCKDAGDLAQLTDGIYTKGFFWTQKSTVGWGNTPQLEICIDLEKEEPICGVSWNTAAGASGVTWPLTINLYVSNDAKNWELVGDLTLLAMKHGTVPENGYTTFKYSTNDLKTKGRYITFQACASPYTFVDEIEVYRGEDSWLKELKPNYTLTDIKTLGKNKLIENGVNKRMMTDLSNIERLLKNLQEPVKSKALAAADSLRKELSFTPGDGDFKAIMPLCESHAKILALNSYILRSQGFTMPFLWKNSRWSLLTLTAIPSNVKMQPITIDMIRNEVRSETFNITNPTDNAIHYKISASGIPKEANLELCEIIVTDTKQGIAIGDAIRKSENATLDITVPAGCTRQVWLRFNRPKAKAGNYSGIATVKPVGNGNALTAAINLNIHAFDFPKRPTMHVGGWDYTNGEGNYYKAKGNLADNLAIMRDMYTDSPWATAAVIPKNPQFDAQGHLLNAAALDFANWDEWTKRWDDARNYCVFWYSGKYFSGIPMGTTKFNTALGEFMNAWTAHIKAQGKSPEQLVILLVDEPNNHAQDEIIIAWAKAIKAANSDALIFEDPLYSDPTKGLPEMFSSVDILCPNTSHRTEKVKDFYIKQRNDGRTLWLYSCSGPAKLHDPIMYHRVQSWYAYEIGAVGTFFWAFGCGGGIGDSWASYTQPGTEYSPYFVSQTSTMHSKHSEAIREGVEDYEYMVMLQNRIDELRKQGKTAVADKAQADFDSLFKETIAKLAKNGGNWNVSKDFDLLDNARLGILSILDSLK